MHPSPGSGIIVSAYPFIDYRLYASYIRGQGPHSQNEESYHWDYSRILGYWNAWQTGSWDRNYEIILIIKVINTSKEEIAFSYTLRDSNGNYIDHEESTVSFSYLSPIFGIFAAHGDYCTIYIGGYYGVCPSRTLTAFGWMNCRWRSAYSDKIPKKGKKTSTFRRLYSSLPPC